MSGETRARIVEAAFRALARDGYEATTVKSIADEADVAPGLVHYYFKTKEELVIAALAVCTDKMARSRGQEPAAEALDRLADFKAGLRSDRDFHRLFVEMVGIGLHNPAVAAGVLGFIRQDRAFIESLARDIIAAREDRSQAEAPALAAAVEAAVIGIVVQSLVDPDFDADAAVDALAAMALR